MNASTPHTRPSSSAKADDPVFQSVGDRSRGRGVLDTPLEPVIGLAGGETRWRGTTAYCGVALCSAVALLALAMLWRSTRAGRQRQHPFLPIPLPCRASGHGLSLALAPGRTPR